MLKYGPLTLNTCTTGQKSLKRDNIDNLCLWLKEEQACRILTSERVSKLRYRGYAKSLKCGQYL